ncbi:MAG: polysaccharide pyruvyl transferase family protein [Candidatus Ornithomonoglobus sp.]
MDKNIYIVTVYNSMNPGSFLQATAIYRAVEKLGYNSVFLETGARNIKTESYIKAFHKAKKLRFSEAKERIELGARFEDALKDYRTGKCADPSDSVFILGSDEIWNAARPSMARYPIFWGKGLPLERCMSYAPSINYAQHKDIAKHKYAVEALNKLQALSVRDLYSKQILSEFTDRDIKILCDPTVLLTVDDYIEMEAECEYSGYILAYIYSNKVAREDIRALRKFADKKKKKLISFGEENSWCDKCVKGNAFDFLTYISHADYVCTSTFHGTMLSVIYNKQFASFSTENLKVSELLGSLNLPRLAAASNLEEIIETKYDYDAVNKQLMEMRTTSIEYLENGIKEILRK